MRAGDIIRVDFGVPLGSEAGLVRFAVVVSADAYLGAGVSTATVVPVTSTERYASDVGLDGLDVTGVAQCRLITTVSVEAITDLGHENVGPTALAQIRSVVGDLLDITA